MPIRSIDIILCDQLVNCTLKHVPFEGWTLKALAQGAQDAGIEAQEALVLFNHDIDSLISHYSAMLDRHMTDAAGQPLLEGMKVRERIAVGIMARFGLLAPHREAAYRALVYLSRPTKLALASQLVYRTVNTMWYNAGDTATDFNFYTKRALLAGVYSSALVYWLNDNSLEFSDTKAFVDRRIAEVMKIPKIKASLKSFGKALLKPLRFFRP